MKAFLVIATSDFCLFLEIFINLLYFQKCQDLLFNQATIQALTENNDILEKGYQDILEKRDRELNGLRSQLESKQFKSVHIVHIICTYCSQLHDANLGLTVF